MKTIDLGQYRDEGRNSFSGDDRGRQVRSAIGVDRLDELSERVVISAPDDVRAITASFFQGLFEQSIRKLGVEGFRRHYIFRGHAFEETVDRVLEYASRTSSPV
ncbi:MAG: hypothetical protein QGM45_11450 [Anaerolineales bacterium]|nr:hypothetical protein [Anaerolineales bacterium]